MTHSHLPGAVAAACLTLATTVPAFPATADSAPTSPAQVTLTQDRSSELKSLSIEQLMEIDVTSVSRRSEPVSGAAAAITVITGEDIRRSGANNLPDALRIAAGVEVAQSNGNTWAISTRGFNTTTANKLLVLIDGRSIYTPLFSGVFWDVQDLMLEDIERIEIIRGPGATLWGANAVNGVINILTKSARDTPGQLLSAGGGTEEQGFAAFRQGGKIGQGTAYRAYGKYSYRDSLALANGGSARDPLRRGQAGFRLDRGDTGNGGLNIQGDAYHGLAGQTVVERADTVLDGANLLGRWTHTYAHNAGSDLQIYYDYTHREIPRWFEEHRHTLDVDYQHRQPLGPRQDLVWGAGYRFAHDQVGNSAGVAFLPDHVTENLFSAFAQDELTLARHLRLTVGSKLEHNRWTGFEFQPSVRLAWVPDDRRTLWGAISRAVRTPTRYDEDIVFYTAGTTAGTPLLEGSSRFAAENLLAYELGYRVQPRTGLLVDLSAFYNVYDNLRSFQPAAAPAVFPYHFANQLNAETWGLEGRVSWQAAQWWRVYAGYAYFDKNLSLDPGSLDPTDGKAEGNDPRSRATLRSLMNLPRGFELDGMLRYVARLPSPVVPAYTELDLRLGWQASDRLELSLVGQNLLHARHPEFGPPSPLREEVQRGAYGKVTWRF